MKKRIKGYLLALIIIILTALISYLTVAFILWDFYFIPFNLTYFRIAIALFIFLMIVMGESIQSILE